MRELRENPDQRTERCGKGKDERVLRGQEGGRGKIDILPRDRIKIPNQTGTWEIRELCRNSGGERVIVGPKRNQPCQFTNLGWNGTIEFVSRKIQRHKPRCELADFNRETATQFPVPQNQLNALHKKFNIHSSAVCGSNAIHSSRINIWKFLERIKFMHSREPRASRGSRELWPERGDTQRHPSHSSWPSSRKFRTFDTQPPGLGATPTNQTAHVIKRATKMQN